METAIILNTWWLKVLAEIEAKKTKNSVTKKLKAKIKYPGISKDSEKLGVSRQHLWEVLEGNRASKRLSARYAELKAKQHNEK